MTFTKLKEQRHADKTHECINFLEHDNGENKLPQFSEDKETNEKGGWWTHREEFSKNPMNQS
jgi:hypothetical protein